MKALAILAIVLLASGCVSVTGESVSREISEELTLNLNGTETPEKTARPETNESIPELPEPEPKNTTEPETDRGCLEDWACEDWGPCFGGFIRRECLDLNSCGTEHEIPVMSAECDSPEPLEIPDDADSQGPENPEEPDVQEAPEPGVHILISEVFYDTPGKDSEEEWIRLYNPGPETDMAGWSISDNSGAWAFPEGFIFPEDSSIVVARSLDGFVSLFGCSADIGGFTRALNNDGDALILSSPDSLTDSVNWENFEGWDISASEGKSIKRKDYSDRDSAEDWLSEQDPAPCS